MEIMSREEYFEEIAEKLLKKLVELDTTLNKVYIYDDNAVAKKTNSDIVDWLDLEGRYDEINAILNNDLYDAYDKYCEEAEPYHNYEVTISVNYAASVHVKAKSEDEAREYVSDNLSTNSTEVYMDDDEYVLEDVDTGVDYAEWELEDVCDCGEYEE